MELKKNISLNYNLIDASYSNLNIRKGVVWEEVFDYHKYINEQVFGLEPYVIGTLIAIGLALVLFLLSFVLGTHIKILEKEKLSLFECGFIPLNDSRQLFFVNFYRISILFILFDIEISYLFPWTRSFFDHLLPVKPYVIEDSFFQDYTALSYYYYLYIFLLLLAIGIIYEYNAKALELQESESYKI